ncbi:uncharacterized protein K452DRAFT_302950 [Aplosporella prunicola CBS 121167]|uniref:Ribosome recycling factor domain-containing protein n=1 Tax=Aplosporella prunicola CBS 121167 TaxID=1176127 RepID=A0A6A6AY71_9PEZI|nr:uncharacterized protein K452DRAFT_302950 [Aplosporella prunicola CBS 121167]KAF2136218.1 hypothetical protein K452DRAFT_302950 [Aplosporella prunicola CBS 121167]
MAQRIAPALARLAPRHSASRSSFVAATSCPRLLCSTPTTQAQAQAASAPFLSAPSSSSAALSSSAAPFHSARLFSTSRALAKKSGKANLSHARSDSSPPVAEAGSATPTDEAYDLSTLEAAILRAIEALTHELAELRAGGRFNPEHLEKLRVTLKGASGKDTVRLGELAQVIPKGRVLGVVVGDEDHIKPLMTAIQASGFSLTPQAPTPDNPTTITVPIPPPTGETRRAALDAAHKAEEKASLAVQNARTAHNKRIRALEVKRTVRPDDVVKAKKLMDECAKKGQSEVKRIVDGARRVLESA